MAVLVPTSPSSDSATSMPHTAPSDHQLTDATSEKEPSPSNSSHTQNVSAISRGNIPVVSLDTDVITDAVAARLATTMLGHVLFLKSQIPLPVIQLSRISSAKSSTRATKHRNELLSSFDTLNSHLNTTFTAISTALAKSHGEANNTAQGEPGVGDLVSKKNCARVYLAIVLGSSIGTAKSKVIFAVDGLETKIWGARDDSNTQTRTSEKEEKGEDFKREEGDTEDSSGSESESVNEDEDDDDESVGDDTSETSYCEADGEAHSSERSSTPQSRSPSPLRSPPELSYAEQQRRLHVADRLLSRTLATADGEGHGISSEMAPTQTHVFLRAPRRFLHPAWIPRQNLSASLEGTLDAFLVESGMRGSSDTQVKKRGAQKNKPVEGVWVTCRNGLEDQLHEDEVQIGGDEWDETIWWSWDGKLVGFSEW